MPSKFSIIIPVFNGGKTLPHVLLSIYEQSFQDYEVILYDDLSTDNSASILNLWKKKFKNKCKVFYGKKNNGAYFAGEKMLGVATGSYIVYGAQDNIFSSDRLETINRITVENPNNLFITSNCYVGTLKTFLKKKGLLLIGLSTFLSPSFHSLLLFRSAFFQFDNIVAHKSYAKHYYNAYNYSPSEDFYFVFSSLFNDKILTKYYLHINKPLLYKIDDKSSQTYSKSFEIFNKSNKIISSFSLSYSVNFFGFASSKLLYLIRAKKRHKVIRMLFFHPHVFFCGVVLIFLRYIIHQALSRRKSVLKSFN